MDGDGGGEEGGGRNGGKPQLDADPAGAEAEPPRPPARQVGKHECGGEGQQADEDVGPHPRPAVWNTRELQPRWSFWSDRLSTHPLPRLLPLPVPVRVPRWVLRRSLQKQI